jgi:hypothetical protein
MAEQPDLYRVTIRLANARIGSPMLRLNLLVDAPSGEVFGSGEIVQTTTPPNNKLEVVDIRGSIHHTGFGHDERLISLRGMALQVGPPTEPITIELPMTAAIAVGPEWKGRGSFSFGRREVSNCIVTPEPASVAADAEAALIVEPLAG